MRVLQWRRARRRKIEEFPGVMVGIRHHEWRLDERSIRGADRAIVPAPANASSRGGDRSRDARVWRRNNGVLQVTLRGLPLYHYSADHAKGEANGQSIRSFGGTWHVLSATSNVSPVAPTAPTTPSPTPSYGY
jgi:hypothetical protein